MLQSSKHALQSLNCCCMSVRSWPLPPQACKGCLSILIPLWQWKNGQIVTRCSVLQLSIWQFVSLVRLQGGLQSAVRYSDHTLAKY
jgi:hypothetical protein